MNMNELHERYQILRREQPKLRVRDAAAQLGVPEAALVAADPTATRLAADWSQLVLELPSLGHVMALTRNEHAVSEVKGRYAGISFFHAGMGQVLGQAIDLRLFMSRWAHGFAVHGEARSLQFFDGSGTAVHKVHLLADSDGAAFDALVGKYATGEAVLTFEPFAPSEPELTADAAVDVAALRAGWDTMRDTHDFFPLLRRLAITRRQALRLAGAGRAQRVGNAALNAVLERACAAGLPIMIFVGNPGVLQVRSGRVDNVKRLGPWLNVLDPDFNLHLREDHIADSWVVEKPTSAGAVSSLELFAADGTTIAMLFVKREDREQAENPVWRDVLAGLPAAEPAT